MANIYERITQAGKRGKTMQMLVLITILVAAGLIVNLGPQYNKMAGWIDNKTGHIINLPRTKNIPFRLGLDLQGGTQLTYKADLSALPEEDHNTAIEGARDVIERRVNAYGVSEPRVETKQTATGERQIAVELAGVKDVGEAIKMIGETPLLEFKEPSTEAPKLTAEQQKQLDEYNKAAEARSKEVLGKLQKGGDFSELAKQYSEDEKTRANGGDLGWVTEQDQPIAVDLAKDLKQGQISKAEKMPQAFNIVKLEGKREKADAFDETQKEKEVKASHILICYKGADSCQSESSKEEALKKIKELRAQATPKNFAELAKKNSTESGASQSGGELGWFQKGAMVQAFEDATFSLKTGAISEPIETKFGYHIILKEGERNITEYNIRILAIKIKTAQDILGTQEGNWKNTELTGKNLKSSSVQFSSQDNSPEVTLAFDDEGAKLFEDITRRNVGKQVAIFLDGDEISAPNVNEAISGGKAVISGKFNVREAKLLAQRLNAGALPVPITLVSQQTVGASLGQAAVSDSLRAALIGLALVALFMILFYRLPGLMAVCALLAYGVLVLAIFKIWPVTLTLPGLAGFVMSIGVAVDANVLIFARLKEELRAGKPLNIALDEAFRRAWPSIRDGNFSTLITCLILIWFSTSIVKGFAVTLALGVVVSLFSGIIITRNFLNLIYGEWLEKRPWLVGMKKNNN